MRRRAIGVWLGVIMALLTASAAAEDSVPIAVGAQPGGYASLPLFIASEKGWWEAVGLRPLVLHYESQEFLLDDKGWDVGIADPLTALLGADRFGLLTVGIADDASDANVVMARPSQVEAILKDPAALKGKTLLLTRDTTAEYATRGCLARWRLRPQDMRVVSGVPAEVAARFAASADDLAALAAPSHYAVFEENAGITVCSGKDAGAIIPDALVARTEFAAAHPERVARFVAVVLHAVAWEKAHRDETIDLLRRYYRENGIALSDASLARELDTRPIFTLDEQLKLLDRSKDGVSTADIWFGRLAAYLVSTGLIEIPPLGQTYLTERFVRWTDGAPGLHAFVEGE